MAQGGYATFEPSVAGTAGSGPTSSSVPPAVTKTSSTKTSSTKTSSTKTSSTKTSSIKISSTSHTHIPSSTSIDIPIQSDATQFTFTQLHDGKNVFPLREAHFLHSDFDQICATYDCQADCFNMTRVFSATQYALADSTDGHEVDIPVTLFGICSNLPANATESIIRNGDEKTAPFFPRPLAQISKDSDLLAANLTTCLATTCEMTRRPSECVDYCGPGNLLQSPTEFNFSSGLFGCAAKLCSNTCGLPFANQDVFGIGVLISYYIQAVLLLVLAVAVLASAAWQLFRYGRSPQVMGRSKPIQTVLKKFLATECYFGVTAGVASFFMSPEEVDPLNGYALVAVSLMGCIGPVFTLLLLHSHDIKSGPSTALCLASWLLNTVVFYMLFGNLSNSLSTIERVDKILRNMFQTEYCGNSSAMVLCQEWTGSNPMKYLSEFYNQNMVINIHNVPVLWAYATLVLLVLMVMQVLGQRGRPVSDRAPTKDSTPMEKRTLFRRILQPSPQCWRFLLLLATITLFSLAISCQYVMVSTYHAMDVIDTHEWSFGQVVAVLIWVPTLLEVVESCLGKKETQGTEASLTKPEPIPPAHLPYSESRQPLSRP